MDAKPEFDSLVHSYSTEIFRYLWRIFQDAQKAEDCLQDTFLKAYSAYERFRWPGHPRAWLYRIATNTAFSQLKRDKNLQARAERFSPADHPEPISVSDQVENRWILSQVRAAIDELPPRQRSAFLMRKYQDLSYEEIALALGCSAEAARANAYQALNKLRKQFADLYEPEVNR